MLDELDLGGDIKVGNTVLLRADPSLPMSVHKIESGFATCQWIANKSVRKATFHVSQLRCVNEPVSDEDLDDFIASQTLHIGAAIWPGAIRRMLPSDLLQLEQFALALHRMAADELRTRVHE
jgi:hypothetical protein